MNLSDKQFDTLQKKVIAGTDPTAHPEYLVSTANRDEVIVFQGDWGPKFLAGGEDASATRNHTQVKQKDDSRKVFQKRFNLFLKSDVKDNNHIPNDKKIEWGVHIDETTKTKRVVGEDIPVTLSYDLSVRWHVGVHYKSNLLPTSNAMPEWADVVEVWATIIVAGSPDNFVFICDSPEDYISAAFPEADAGKGVKLRLRYKLNTKDGGPGDFGADIITVIPS
jgi:hypothetical protein